MKRISFFLTMTAILAISSCTKERIHGRGPVATETRNVAGFTAVSVSGSTNVYITQGAIFKVEVKGYSNLLSYFETKVVNNTLELGFKQDVSIGNDNTAVYISMPALYGLGISGSGNISTSGDFIGNTNFNARIEGSGDIHFSRGSTQNFYSTIAGSGSIYTIGLTADKADIITTGSGNTEITAFQQLKVKIEGSGNVYYRGTPVISTQITGSGAVLPR